MKKTKREKASHNIARFLMSSLDDEVRKSFKLLDLDVPTMIAFGVLADKLKAARANHEINFKKFCKTHGLTQYKVRNIEDGDAENLDHWVFKKYVSLLNMKTEVMAWTKYFPNTTWKYKITVDGIFYRRGLKI